VTVGRILNTVQRNVVMGLIGVEVAAKKDNPNPNTFDYFVAYLTHYTFGILSFLFFLLREWWAGKHIPRISAFGIAVTHILLGLPIWMVIVLVVGSLLTLL